MKTLYIECNMGVAGDMLLASLIELMQDKENFLEELNNIGLENVSFSIKEEVKQGIVGSRALVSVSGSEEESVDVGHAHNHDHSHDNAHDHSHSHNQEDNYPHTHIHMGLAKIHHIIDSLKIDSKVKDKVKQVYDIIAAAESKVHGRTVSEVHFHEVGMLDAIADITACIMAFYKLEIEYVVVSPIHVGFGQVKCAHGILPVPAPATALILKDIPCYAGEVRGELCTPTGAALVKVLADEFSYMPVMTISKIGYGMGKKEFPFANCVRAIIGEMESKQEKIVELCCNLDDITAEELGYAMEVFWEEKALDVYTTSIGMKKSRPGIMLTVMCHKEDVSKFKELIFRHTTTLGIREYTCNRVGLNRRVEEVQTDFGKIARKTSKGFGITKTKYEYEDLKQIARENNLSIREVREQLK